jgi:hypothetical protein
MNPAGGRKCGDAKICFLTERTQGFIANKGLISRRCARTDALLMPNERKFKPKMGQKLPFVWL